MSLAAAALLAPALLAQHTLRVWGTNVIDDTCSVSVNGRVVYNSDSHQHQFDASFPVGNSGKVQMVVTNLGWGWRSGYNVWCHVAVDGRELDNGHFNPNGWDPPNRTYPSPVYSFDFPPPPPPPPPRVVSNTRSYDVRLANGRIESQHVEQCFGAVGSGCDGIPVVAPRTGSANDVTLEVSVGSIEHDNCCLLNPDGNWCSSHAQVISLQVQDSLRQYGTCAAEWRKAFWNAMDGRQWQATFRYSSPGWSDDLSPAAGRPTLLPDPEFNYTVPNNWGETAATRELLAPAGTKLDIMDAGFCQSGRFSQTTTAGLTWVLLPVPGLRWASAYGVCAGPYSTQAVVQAAPPAGARLNLRVGQQITFPVPAEAGTVTVSTQGGIRAEREGANLVVAALAPGAASLALRNARGETASVGVDVAGAAPPVVMSRATLVQMAFQDAYGRAPSPSEREQWGALPASNPLVANPAALTGYLSGLLRSNGAERAAVVQRAFQAKRRRAPTPREASAWEAYLGRTGQGYAAVLAALGRQGSSGRGGRG